MAPPEDQRVALVDQLHQLLCRQLEAHRALLQCAQAKRQALRTADLAALAETQRQEQLLVTRMSGAERQRTRLTGQLAAHLGLDGSVPITVGALAEHLDDPGPLLETAAALRDVAAAVRRESSIVSAAAEALNRHLSGLVLTMHSALSRAGVYGRQGEVSAGAQLHFNVDLKS